MEFVCFFFFFGRAEDPCNRILEPGLWRRMSDGCKTDVAVWKLSVAASLAEDNCETDEMEPIE